MSKLSEAIKCNPLVCLSTFSVIVVLLFGSIKSDVQQIRQEITGIYSIMIEKYQNTALLSPVERNSALYYSQSADR